MRFYRAIKDIKKSARERGKHAHFLGGSGDPEFENTGDQFCFQPALHFGVNNFMYVAESVNTQAAG